MSRRIPKEIKEEILSKVQAGERVADLAEQYGVSAKSIYGWLRQASGEAVVSVLEYNKLKRENEELKRLIGELTLNMHQQKKVEIVRRSKLKSVCADALGISRKNIYRQLRQPAKDLALKAQIEAVHHEHPAYGHRRVALHLKINHKRAQRVMAKFKLKPPRRRVKRYSTVSTSQHSYKNLLKNRTVTRPHQVWCSDLSRILYRGTLWYIATIEDLFTRQIIAQRMGKRHDSHLVLATLRQALATGYQPQVFHSDQGNEFMAQRCTDYLEQRDILVSVSDVASPWQNGYIESFFGRFKHELGDLNRFDSPGEMIEAIYRHTHYYNHHRIHTALKMPPAVFAAKMFSDNGLHVWGT